MFFEVLKIFLKLKFEELIDFFLKKFFPILFEFFKIIATVMFVLFIVASFSYLIGYLVFNIQQWILTGILKLTTFMSSDYFLYGFLSLVAIMTLVVVFFIFIYDFLCKIILLSIIMFFKNNYKKAIWKFLISEKGLKYLSNRYNYYIYCLDDTLKITTKKKKKKLLCEINFIETINRDSFYKIKCGEKVSDFYLTNNLIKKLDEILKK